MPPKMYEKGQLISSMAELEAAMCDDTYIYIEYAGSGRGRPTHKAFLRNWPYRTICNYVNCGRAFKADKTYLPMA